MALKLGPKLGFGFIHIVGTHKEGGERSSQMHTTAYKGGEGGFQGCVRTQKQFFLDHKISKRFFFVQKNLLHCHLLLCIENCKPALSCKWNHRNVFDIDLVELNLRD